MERVGQLAARQHGRLSWAQLRHLEVPTSTIDGWLTRGYLTRVLPKIYAIGHEAPSREADLWAAILYAGPGAMLTGGTQAHWMGLIDYAPRVVEVTTPRRIRSVPGVRVHGRRSGIERRLHSGLPVAPIPLMLLDLAAGFDRKVVNRALTQLDHSRRLDVRAIQRACGPGHVGSLVLREMLAAYDPKLKYANGRLEEAFARFCKRHRLPSPLLNVRVHGVLSDVYWPDARLVVELDSEDNHSSPAQRRRDRRNDLRLRGHGLTVLRYDWVLVHDHADDVYRDVIAALERGLTVGGPLATDIATGGHARG